MADTFAPMVVRTKTAGDIVINVNAGQTIGLSAGAANIGTVNIAAAQTIGLSAGAATIGAVNIAAAQTLATVTTVGAVTAITNALPTGANTIGTVNIAAAQTIGLSAGAATIGAVNIAAAQTLSTVTTVGAVTAITNALPTGANTIGAVNIAAGQTIALSAGAAIIGSLTANQSVNTTQLNGVAISVGSGASGTGTQRVILATDQGTIPVSQGLSFVTVDSGHLTSASLAAGATVTLDGPQIASGVGKLFEATVSSSVALKAQLGTWDGTTFIVKRTFFVLANQTLPYEPSRYDAITLATGATAKFRWSITNNDNVNPADVYASITQAI
jgi:hypothetical protein